MGWRLIDTDVADPYFVTAADDAISQARREKKIENTLHFYRRFPAAISVGRFRKIQSDINVDECLNNNIKIVRRSTGGGTIFTDEQCLVYSLVFDKENITVHSAQEIFQSICNSLINALKRLNINAEYKPPNDILLNGKKISGSAQIKKDNIILIHGTILVDTNLKIMKKVIKIPKNSLVSTICKEIFSKTSIDDIKEELKKEFEIYFNDKFENTTFSLYENNLIDKLLKEKYLNDAWNFKR